MNDRTRRRAAVVYADALMRGSSSDALGPLAGQGRMVIVAIDGHGDIRAADTFDRFDAGVHFFRHQQLYPVIDVVPRKRSIAGEAYRDQRGRVEASSHHARKPHRHGLGHSAAGDRRRSGGFRR